MSPAAYVRSGLAFVAVCCLGILLQAQQQRPADPPKPFTGKVVAIADGDTITVLYEKTQHRIRFQHIDAPESGQDFGTKAKQILGDKVFGKDVKVVWTERDRYGRILGEVFLEQRNVNLELVKEGYAWHYRQYSKDADYAKAEKSARELKAGLWAHKSPVAPWDFRRGKRSDSPTDPKTDLPKKDGAAKENPETITVYITRTGKKYHTGDCRYLAKSKIPIALERAAFGYEPCSVCRPPVLKKGR